MPWQTDPLVNAFVEGLLRVLIAVWPVWLLLALLATIDLTLAVCRRRWLARSGLRDVDAMSGHDFERYLAFLFGKLGFHVQRTARHGDFGADLVASSKGERVVIQAKRYRRKVGVRAVQEAVAARGYYSCERAMVVTNSVFTRQAAQLADRNDVELWDRYRLAKEMTSIGGRRATAQAMAHPAHARAEGADLTTDGKRISG